MRVEHLDDSLGRVAVPQGRRHIVTGRVGERLERLARHGRGGVTTEPADRFRSKGVAYIDPLGYLDFVALVSRARLVLTDSGGIQEEATVLGVPCLTLRETTERPVTVTHGTNRVIGSDPGRILGEALQALAHPPRRDGAPPLWDGHAAERIVDILETLCQPKA